MRQFETHVQEIKNEVLKEVAALTWSGKFQTGILDIPEKVIPGPEPTTRCCIYKERAIIGSRVKVALGGDPEIPGLVELLPIACDECPVTEITVGDACRGCLATRCVHTCPRDAIKIVDRKAQIDRDQCVMCGKCIPVCPYGAIVKNLRPCERGCPVGAISMGPDRKASIDYEKCIVCGNCVYQCPFGAIMDKSFVVDVIHMLMGAQRWGYHVWAAVAPSVVGQFPGTTMGQLVSALKAIGFYDMVPVSYGADLTALEESKELAEKGMLTTSCCPAYVNYVEKNFPELAAEMVSHTPSPMVLTARMVKEKDPGARVVFIGPCIAKKHEFQLGKTMGAVDCVLTFEELNAMLEAKQVIPEELEESEIMESSGHGWRFAAGGGVTGAVAAAMEEQGIEFDLKAVPCSGIEECKMALLKASKGVLDGNFIEGMMCTGGCINGPGNLIRTSKNKVELEKHAKQTDHVNIKK